MGDKYSKKDLNLLYELSINSRSPLNHIAKKIKTSQQGINYKIKLFQEKGIISNFITIFDYSSLGFDCFRVFLRLNYSKPEHYESIIQSLLTNDSIISITPCSGKWDLIILFASKNASKFNKSFQEIIKNHPHVFENFEVLTTISTSEYGRRYLADYSSHLGNIVYGGDRNQTTLDLMDKKIILELLESPRSSYVNLSLKLKLNPKTIIHKIKSLEARGIIKGYSINFDPHRLNFLSYKILLKLHNLTPEKSELLKFCRQNKNIICLSKTLGYWNLELDAELSDTSELNNFIHELKRKFNFIISDIDIIQTSKSPKISFIPKSFFTE
jgi:DNA-binding Lrp family transcriptional regulator